MFRSAAAVHAARGRRSSLLSLALLAVAVGALACHFQGATFSAPGGLTRKQSKANLHTRGNLKPPVEIPLEEPEPEEAPAEPLPDYRTPYTMHVVSHFPNHRHLHEESGARKFIVEKIMNSFKNFDDMIRHIEVNLQVSENFHRAIDGSKKVKVTEVDGEAGIAEENVGAKALAPYVFKVTVSLRNHRSIVLANAEKHAQPTLTEGLDHMVDVIKRSLREEKDKDIKARKKARAAMDVGMDDEEIEEPIFEELEEATTAKDNEIEAIYKAAEEVQQ